MTMTDIDNPRRASPTVSSKAENRGRVKSLYSDENDIPSESERVPLEVRDLRAAQENVLASASGRLLLLDLDFHDFRRMLNDLRDVCPVTRADFTKNTLVDPDNSTDEPVALQVRKRIVSPLCLRQIPGELMIMSSLTQKTPMVFHEQ